MKIDAIRALLDNYQKGICTEEERKAIEEWYDNLQFGEDTPLSPAQLEDSLARIRSRLPHKDAREQLTMSFPARQTVLRRIHRIRPALTAAAILAILIGLVWWQSRSGRDRQPGMALSNSPDTLILTGRGETRSIILPDGSTIHLNAATAFSYPRHFSGPSRTVTLIKGEAYFQVVPNPAHPFIVLTGQLRTTVLGTSFDIRSYEHDPAIQIAVLTGKISVENGPAPADPLLPHQSIRVDKSTGKEETDSFENAEDMIAWKTGGLNFKDASFDDLTFEIGNKFNVGLINKSDKHQWSYTGLFRDESLQEVIETICQTEHLSYTFTDSAIVITNQ